MKQIKCPVCDKRLFDSNIPLQVNKLNGVNLKEADMVMKCNNCKCCIATNLQNVETIQY
jgi:hypothetical protein